MEERPQGDELTMQVAQAFAAFGPAYARWLHSRLPEGGMTLPRIRLLWVLHCRSPQIMSSLSDALGVTPRNVTGLVDALEEEGLVRRRPHETDRRATLVELTPEGERAGDTMYAEHTAATAKLFAHLSQDDQRELLRLMGLLHGALQSEGIAVRGARREG